MLTVKAVIRMSDLTNYLAAIAQGHVLLSKCLITEQEYVRFEEKMRQKYNLPEHSIFRENRLLCSPGRGNMPH